MKIKIEMTNKAEVLNRREETEERRSKGSGMENRKRMSYELEVSN